MRRPLPDGVEFRYRRGDDWHVADPRHRRAAARGGPPAGDEAGTAQHLTWTIRLPAHGRDRTARCAWPHFRTAPRTGRRPPAAQPGPARLRTGRRGRRLRPRHGRARQARRRRRRPGAGLRGRARGPRRAAGPGHRARTAKSCTSPAAGVPVVPHAVRPGLAADLPLRAALPRRSWPPPRCPRSPPLQATAARRGTARRSRARSCTRCGTANSPTSGRCPTAATTAPSTPPRCSWCCSAPTPSSSGDTALARRLEPHARAAVEWMDTHGGLGRARLPALHRRRGRTGQPELEGLARRDLLRRRHAGHRAPWPSPRCRATPTTRCVRTARLARDGVGRHGLRRPAGGRRRRRCASGSRRDFWMPAAGLPGPRAGRRGPAGRRARLGRRAPAVVGHPGPRTARERSARRLLEPDFFSGWGVRTLAAGQAAYHPLSYHRGSVWPHDNAVIALGHGPVRAARGGPRPSPAGCPPRPAPWTTGCPRCFAGYGRDEHPRSGPLPALLLPAGVGGGHAARPAAQP